MSPPQSAETFQVSRGRPARINTTNKGDAAMAEDVQLISDDEGLAVIGERTAVERFLKSVGHWASSQELDLRPLRPYLAIGADAAGKASEIAENSGRWIKLTEESAARQRARPDGEQAERRREPLMIPGLSGVGKWLQTEQDGAPLLANPAAAGTLSGILARAATQQDMAQVVAYLKTIDHKVDDVLRKVDDAQVAKMEESPTRSSARWRSARRPAQSTRPCGRPSTSRSPTIAATQAYALGQLDAIARRLENTKVGDLAEAAALAETDVPKWLGVLAQCFRLQDAVEVIELDRVLA